MGTYRVPDEEKIKPQEERPEPKFSTEYMDRNADPLSDFHTFAYGKWLKENPIPADRFRWGATEELDERNKYILGKILEECAEEYNESTIRGRLGAFYISAMDRKKIDSVGIEPLRELLQSVNSIKNVDELFTTVSDLHAKKIFTFFSQESFGDLRNSSVYALYLLQGGLSLPSKDYYLKPEFKELREQFLTHITRMFKLLGESKPDLLAQIVMDVENELASKSRFPEEMRDPEKNYNKVEVDSLGEFTGNKRFRQYITDIKLGHIGYVVVGQPEFFKHVSSMLEKLPLDNWKIFLKWKIIQFSAPYLSKDFEEEHFDFFFKKLVGQKEMQRRWKRITRLTDNLFGEALGKIFVEKKFTDESKRRMEEMISDLKEAFEYRLQNLSWMSAETREKGLEKFGKFRAKIGYPSKFIDYSSIKVDPSDFFGNVMRAVQFDVERSLMRTGKPVDRELWEMTPPTVNAYFSPTDNEIVFPAGILQPPFFDARMDDAVNYGATGGTIAHEITHGFDDEGRKFDKDGNLGYWWTKEDEEKFNKKADQVVKLYSSVNVLEGVNVNGKLTLGENIADIGGIAVAIEALENHLKKHPEKNVKIEGFTPIQRFFLGWAQGWRTNSTTDFLKMQLSRDPHSPENIRTDIPSMVCAKFDDTFREFSKLEKSNVPKIEIW